VAEDSCKHPIALLIIDVINDMEFEEGKLLLKQALPMARMIATLKTVRYLLLKV
jgi:hypothetical protein